MQDWSLHPGVQGEGEGGAQGEGEVEGLALAGQCLAKGQTLGCQGGGDFITHCGLDNLRLSENQILFLESSTGHDAIKSRKQYNCMYRLGIKNKYFFNFVYVPD